MKIKKTSNTIKKNSKKILIIILLLIISLFLLYFKNILSSKYHNKSYKIELSQSKENINNLYTNMEDHYKLLFPRKKHHIFS